MATKKLKLGIKLLNQDARLPKRSNPSDAGIDIFSSESIVIQSGATHTIHTGVSLVIPDGYFVRLVGTSGNNSKTGLRVLEGTIDQGYTGEVKVIVELRALEGQEPDPSGERYVIPTQPLRVPKHSKIGQLILTPQPKFDIEEVEELPETDRGSNGFGSSGTVIDTQA